LRVLPRGDQEEEVGVLGHDDLVLGNVAKNALPHVRVEHLPGP
jgi:hypothetical protein